MGIELIGDKQPNSITVYVEPFLFSQKVYLINFPDITLATTEIVPEIRQVEVSMSQLPDFLIKYNMPEIHFQGDVITAKKIVHDCEELQKKNGTFGSTRYLFDKIDFDE